MGLWVAVDDSIGLAELGAGAAAAALAAALTEVALNQAGTRITKTGKIQVVTREPGYRMK